MNHESITSHHLVHPRVCCCLLSAAPRGSYAITSARAGAAALCILFVVAGLGACATCTDPFAWPRGHDRSTIAPPAFDADDPRRLPMLTGEGEPLDWDGLLSAFAWADVILIGEQHDDDMGHRFELAAVEDVLDRWPRSRLSMEMLERDHQVLVDDYLDNVIDASTLARRAHVINWGGPGGWERWFQPIVDAAKDAGAPVIAANAPRRYVRLARLEGYDRLRGLSRAQRELFALPRQLPEGRYLERFTRVMRGAHAADDDNGGHPLQPDAGVMALYRSQMVWDATMAESIARARPTRTAKVIHLVGRFHIDYGGGLVSELRRRRPGARILTVTMVATDAVELRAQDHQRAHVIVYTGEQPEAEDDTDLDIVDDPAELDSPTADEGDVAADHHEH